MHIMSSVDAPDSKVRVQLRSTAIVGADYFITILILFGFAAIRTVSYEVAIRILLIALAFDTIF